MEKEESFQEILLAPLGIPKQMNEVGPYLTPDKKKINSKQIKDLNARAKSTRLLENRQVNCPLLGFGNCFLNMTSKTQATKEQNRYNGLHQDLELLCFKEHHQKSEKDSSLSGRTFPNHISDKGCVSRT